MCAYALPVAVVGTRLTVPEVLSFGGRARCDHGPPRPPLAAAAPAAVFSLNPFLTVRVDGCAARCVLTFIHPTHHTRQEHVDGKWWTYLKPKSGFRFANTHGDHMVLQQSPAKAQIWGFAKPGKKKGAEIKIEKQTSCLESFYPFAIQRIHLFFFRGFFIIEYPSCMPLSSFSAHSMQLCRAPFTTVILSFIYLFSFFCIYICILLLLFFLGSTITVTSTASVATAADGTAGVTGVTAADGTWQVSMPAVKGCVQCGSSFLPFIQWFTSCLLVLYIYIACLLPKKSRAYVQLYTRSCEQAVLFCLNLLK